MHKSFLKGGIDKLNVYLKKTIKLYLLYTAIYMPLTIYGFVKDNLSLVQSIKLFARNTLLVEENYMSWPLWYLLGLIVASFIILLLLKKSTPIKWIAIMGIILMMVGHAMDYLHTYGSGPVFITKGLDLYYKMFMYTRNGFFVGFGYVGIGLAISHYENSIVKYYKWNVLACIASLGYFMAGFYFGLQLFTTLFACLLVKDKFYHGENGVWLRNMSTLIYFFHMYFVFLFSFYIPESNIVLNFILVTISTVCACALILKMKEYIHFHFLNKLLG